MNPNHDSGIAYAVVIMTTEFSRHPEIQVETVLGDGRVGIQNFFSFKTGKFVSFLL